VVAFQDPDRSSDKDEEIMRQEYERKQTLYHQRKALQELRDQNKQQQTELESLRKLLAKKGSSPDVNRDRRREAEEDRPSSSSQLRPTSRIGRPKTRRCASTRLPRDVMHLAERSDRKEVERRDAQERASGRAKSVENAGNDTPKVRNIVLEGVNGKAPSQDDIERKLNPIRPQLLPDAPQAMLAPPAAKPAHIPVGMLAAAQAKATRDTTDFATSLVVSIPLPVVPNRGERQRLGAAAAAVAASATAEAEVADVASSSASSPAEAAASALLRL